MRGVIIGTAGHVDHGKTALVKALTGIDTDRLKEEKKRGITIDLGFAHLDLPGGGRAGIVDVPGHEKFVRNMLAGAGGIDLALLIVAADDGVMPQTREHLGILRLLGVKDGVLVITKADLADPEWAALVADDARSLVKGTFLENAPLHTVSAHTGQGIAELRAAIARKAAEISRQNDEIPFRIPVDRVFSVEGFGTVITGTLIEGTLKEGDEAEIFPKGLRARVRRLQVHSSDVAAAEAGRRVAVNLAGIAKENLARGDVLAAPGSMEPTRMLDVTLTILPDSGRVIENGSRLHFYHGATETLCKAVLLETDRLGPGQEGYAQLRFATPVAVKRGDRFVLRFYSPIETVGGGVVLNPGPRKQRRYHAESAAALQIREHGGDAENLLQAVRDAAATLPSLEELRRQLAMGEELFQREAKALEAQDSLILLGGRYAVDDTFRDKLAERLTALLAQYHAANPLQPGMRRDELRTRLLPGRDSAAADHLLEHLAARGVLRLDNRLAALPDFEVKESGESHRLAKAVEEQFRAAAYLPPALEELMLPGLKTKPDKIALKKTMDALLASGALVNAGGGVFFHARAVAEAKERIVAHAAAHGQITLAEFRDLSGTSRKFALALLEYFDRHGVTKKVGEGRVVVRK